MVFDDTLLLKDVDGLDIVLKNVPNPYEDDSCLHHAWDITISEYSDATTPYLSVSTLIDSYIPVIDFTMGTKERIDIWDPVLSKKIDAKRVDISIGVFATQICLKPSVKSHFIESHATASQNALIKTLPLAIPITRGAQLSCFYIGGFQPAPEKDANGTEIKIAKLVESYSEVRFNSISS